MARADAARNTTLSTPHMQTDINGSVFAGFRRVLHKGLLIFALIITVLIALIVYQHQRSEAAVRSVDHTRLVIAYIDSLRTYLLNLDNAVRKYAETQNPANLDPKLICRQSSCPSAEQLIVLLSGDTVQTARLAPLPALQSALETGFDALQQGAQANVTATPPERELGGFDKSAIDQIHRILIETGREELNQLEAREKSRIHVQNLSSALLGITGLWTGLVLFGLYRETLRLIRAGIDAEQTIRQLSLHDPLTGLANRRFLQQNEKRLIAGAKRSGKQMAVLAIDLDDFKAVNDQFGHAAGDAVIVKSAERMLQLLRESDVIARFGGDEFIIVLGQVDSAEAAREVASRVVESLCLPIPLDGGGVAHIGASVGMAMCCTDNGKETLDDLLKKADTALYAAKREGKRTVREAGTSGV
ncbi:diguanylate cyclase [Thiobacillus sp.]|uniref:diguanylate cyclase n=1 Tax=Thiobacillus sp. TaxID=924 RepID=UPI0025FB3A3E|nr:diguanylate cyclase [Thiobacillus sp.]MBT9538478.1 diguanylate cyclase [Thiobacillus sp.]